MQHRCNNQRLKKARERAGATVVEFALVAPVFFMFLFGMIEFGRLAMVQHSLTNAAREGCRTACLSTSNNSQAVCDSIRNALRPAIANATNTSVVQVNVSPSTLLGLAPGSTVGVDIDVKLSDVSWLPRNLLNLAGDPALHSEAIQVRE